MKIKTRVKQISSEPAVNPFSAGIDFGRQNRRQIMTSKVDPRTEAIQMKRN